MPPKASPLPKHTATREYYGIDKTTDSAPEDIDWPSSADEPPKHAPTTPKKSTSSSKPTTPSSSKSKGKSPLSSSASKSKGESKADDDEDWDMADREERNASPTPSDIVANADMEDVGALAAFNKEMVGMGVGAEARKRSLLRMKVEREERREG